MCCYIVMHRSLECCVIMHVVPVEHSRSVHVVIRIYGAVLSFFCVCAITILVLSVGRVTASAVG